MKGDPAGYRRPPAAGIRKNSIVGTEPAEKLLYLLEIEGPHVRGETRTASLVGPFPIEVGNDVAPYSRQEVMH